MNLLQRRLFVELAKVFFLALAVLLLFILMGRALQLRDMLLGLQLSVPDTLRLFGYLCPFFVLMVCPVACMLAVFLTFLRMGTDRELVALKAGGVSLYQMLPAPLMFAALCTGFAVWVSLDWLAWGMGHFRSEILAIASSRARIVIQPGVFNKDIPGMVFFARQVDPATGTLAHVLVEDASRPDATLTILAPNGHVDTDYDRGELLFLLKNGRIYTEQDQGISVLGFDEYVVRLALSTMFQGLDLGPVKPKEMSWHELISLPVPEIAAEDARLANKIMVERHKRWVFPLACMVLTVFVIPIAVSVQGMRRQNGLILALLLFFAYYSLLSLGITTGESGQMPPLIGIWVPNALFLGFGLYGLHLAAQERMPHVPDFLRRLRRRRNGDAGESEL